MLQEQFSILAANTTLRWTIAHDKGNIDLQKEEIYVGTDIVIGMPKRLQEIYFKNSLNMNKIKLFVIDDAEKMVAQGYQGPIDRLGESVTKCQHLVFTNDLNEKVERLTEKFMEKAIVVEVED
jgi:ATP-dependent RNA helicase RhlE